MPLVTVVPDLSMVSARMPIAVAEVTGIAFEEMHRRMEQVFELSQENCPVDTGLLQSTGKLEVHEHLTMPEIVLSYGDESIGCDYAGYVEVDEPYIEPAVQQVLHG